MICCVIGAETVVGTEKHPIYTSHRMMILEALDSMMQSGVDTYYMALDMGYEIWCARLIMGLKSKYTKVRLICVVDDLGSLNETQRAVLDRADLVMFVAGNIDERHRYMAMRSDYLFDLNDDEEHINSIAGYAQCNNHRLTIVKPI